MNGIPTLSAHWLAWTLGCAVLTLLLLVLLVYWLGRHREREPAEAPGELAPVSEHGTTPAFSSSSLPGDLTLSFVRALKYLRRQTTGRHRLYRVPWFLLLGETGVGKTTLLHALGAEGAAGVENSMRHGLGWSFFDRGVVLDVPGDYLLEHERSWRGLLRLLNRSRPKRPVDGVVLVLPAADFLPDSDLNLADLSRKARHLADKLAQLQRDTGVCFPVYVLVSQCDRMPGFASYCHALPPARLREILGWSSPYRADATFEPAWVDEAFEEIAQSLNRTQSEIFVDRLESTDAGALYFLPSEMLLLRERLRAFLQPIFRPTAYREGYHCRGLYFTGDGPEVAEAGGVLAAELLASPLRGGLMALPVEAPAPNPRPVFLDDLFERKIFPEWGLAYPERRAFSFRRGALLTAQSVALATALVLGLGLIEGYVYLNRLQHQALPVLLSIRNDVTAPAATGEMQDHAHDLLTSIAALGSDRFLSVFYPASWSRTLDHQIVDAVEVAFRKNVLEHIRQGLVDRAQQLSAVPAPAALSLPAAPSADAGGDGPDPLEAAIAYARSDGKLPLAAGRGLAAPAPAAPAAPALDVRLDQLPEYAALRQYVTQVEALEDNLERYQHIITAGSPHPVGDLNALIHYLHPDATGTIEGGDESYLGEALTAASGTPFPPADLARARAYVRAGMKMRGNALYVAWFERNPSLARMRQLADQIDELEGGSYSFGQLQSLQMALDQAEDWTKTPEAAGVADPALLFQGPLAKVTIEPVERSAGLAYSLFFPAPEMEAYIRAGASADWETLHGDFAGVHSDLTGPLLEFEPHSVRLSPGTESLRLPIVNLMSLSFMAGFDGGEFRDTIAAGSQLSWDTAPLQDGAAMMSDYQRYLQEGLLEAPAAVRTAFREIALAHLANNLDQQIARGQIWTPAPDSGGDGSATVAAAKNFEAAQPLLEGLLLDLTQLGEMNARTHAHARLLRLLDQQAEGLLGGLDRELAAESPYGTQPDMANWRGVRPAALAAFDLPSPDELPAYLASQRERLEALATVAAPLVKFLQEPNATLRTTRQNEMLGRWQGIVTALRQYDDKRPGNSVARLESFVGGDLDKMTPAAHCATAAGAAAGAASDYFRQAQARLEAVAAARCQELDSGAARRNYAALAALFNKTLAHRFPFAAADAPQTTEAEPAAVLAFYDQLDRVQPSFGTQLSPAQAAFVEQMNDLRPLWKPLLSHAAKVPVLDVTPTLRVNRGREQGGNQIITWQLALGGAVFQAGPAPKAPARWVLGQPVTLTLVWASNAPQAPVSGGGVATVRGRTVTYTYSDPWSLLRLIASQRAPAADFDGLEDATPNTLAFRIQTAPGTTVAAAGTGATQPTLVFIRLAITSPGTVESLRIPPFPAQAPLDEAATDAGNHAH